MSNKHPENPSEPQADENPSSAEKELVINSEELLQGRNEVQIRHFGETYRLRLTRSGKLLLQK